jgi:endonuclease/exonuclease/phosphatase family metal-dependent hydrolase
MAIGTSARYRRMLFGALKSAVLLFGSVSGASAQSTVTISQPTSEVVFATLRGGTFAETNLSTLLATRASTNREYERRALLKFDTEHTVPAGSAVTSALLTVTVKSGSADASRAIGVYQVTTSWSENEVSWNKRRTGTAWTTGGGDLGSKLATAVVGNTPGTTVTFDVTPLVKMAVAGTLGSRYTRVALLDLEASTSESYREYFMPNDPNAAVRPVLKVTYGGSTSVPPPPPPPVPGPGATLRVLHWNTHHNGIGSDGSLDTARLMAWVAKLNADIISLNEVERFSSGGYIDAPVVMANMLTAATGKTWYTRFATLAGGVNGIGNLILSRFPIDADDTQLLSGGRSATFVTINVNGRTINFASTHLHADSAAYRATEVAQLTAWATTFAEQRIIAGDFNTQATSPESVVMKQTYRDSWADAQAAGTAVAYPANPAGNTRNSRIDYIFSSKAAGFLTLIRSQVFDTRDATGVTPSDHKPLMSTFTVQ